MKVLRNRAGIAATLLLFVAAACATAPRAAEYLDPARLAKLVADPTVPYLLLDVRSGPEFAGGHIPSAINIPYDEIADRMPTVGADTMIIVYCASGHRAGLAAQTLAEMGFSNVANFGAVGRWPGEMVSDG